MNFIQSIKFHHSIDDSNFVNTKYYGIRVAKLIIDELIFQSELITDSKIINILSNKSRAHLMPVI